MAALPAAATGMLLLLLLMLLPYAPSASQVRVLTKDPKGREVADADSFSFNAAFSEKLFRIKINSIQMKETEEENKKTNEQVRQGVPVRLG